MAQVKTNAELRGKIAERGVTVTDVAREMGKSRQWLSNRLNFPARPEQRFIDQVMDAIDKVAK